MTRPTPWPPKTHENYRLVVYKIERVTVSLLTLLNEAAEHNYQPYESLLPNIDRRLKEAYEAAIQITYHAPEGGSGPPLKWVKAIVRTVNWIEEMVKDDLVEIKTNAPLHLYETVNSATNAMLDKCLDILDVLKKVPLPEDGEDSDNNNGDDDNDVRYILDLFTLSLTTKK